MNNYLFHERLEFYLKAEGINSTEAFEAHCKAISQLIDYARTIGLEINEYQQTDCTCWRVEENGEETEVSGWITGEMDEKKI
jgi:hypothetical protein